MRRLLSAILFLALLAPFSVHAVLPDEILSDPVLESRARTLSLELRCLVCQNQSIDDSNAELARDLRVLVRERLLTGETDQEVLNHIRARYGDFVLLNPPVQSSTYLLWYGPLVIVLLGLGLVFLTVRRKNSGSVDVPLNDSERTRLAAALRRAGEE
jgi:cytochrome c-type biogenesis protein CcmH